MKTWPVVLFSEKPTATILPSGWTRTAPAPSSPWKDVVRVPPAPKPTSRLPPGLTLASPKTLVARKCEPAVMFDLPFTRPDGSHPFSRHGPAAGSSPGAFLADHIAARSEPRARARTVRN